MSSSALDHFLRTLILQYFPPIVIRIFMAENSKGFAASATASSRSVNQTFLFAPCPHPCVFLLTQRIITLNYYPISKISDSARNIHIRSLFSYMLYVQGASVTKLSRSPIVYFITHITRPPSHQLNPIDNLRTSTFHVIWMTKSSGN